MKGLISVKKKKRLNEKQNLRCSHMDQRQTRSIEKYTLGICSKFQSKFVEKKDSHEVDESSWSLQKFYAASLTKADSHRVDLERKLNQQEVEISQLSAIMEKLLSARLIQESFNQSLQADLDDAESELVNCKMDVKNLKELVRKIAAEMVARQQRCGVIMDESQATIEVLRQRLLGNGMTFPRLQ